MGDARVNPSQVYQEAIAQTKRSPLPFCCWKIPVKLGFGFSGVIIFSEFIAAIVVGHAVGIVVSVISTLLLLLAVAIVRHMFRHPEAIPAQETTPLKYEQKRTVVMSIANLSVVLRHLVVPVFTVYCLLLLIVRLASTSPPPWNSFPPECPASLQDGCTRIGPPQNRCEGCVMPCSTKPGLLELASHWVDSMCEGRTSLLSHIEHDFEHWQALTSGMGFYDDIAIHTVAASNNRTLLWAQAQQRLGWKDGGVNDDRVRQLTDYVNSQLKAHGAVCP